MRKKAISVLNFFKSKPHYFLLHFKHERLHWKIPNVSLCHAHRHNVSALNMNYDVLCAIFYYWSPLFFPSVIHLKYMRTHSWTPISIKHCAVKLSNKMSGLKITICSNRQQWTVYSGQCKRYVLWLIKCDVIGHINTVKNKSGTK